MYNHFLELQTYSDLANKTEHDPIAPETTAYEKGSSIFQYELISCPGVDSKSSPFLNNLITQIMKLGGVLVIMQGWNLMEDSLIKEMVHSYD